METFLQALPSLGQAFALIFQPMQLVYLVGGVLLGLSIGVLPGLGGIAGLALLLPFMYGMEPVSGLALMIGLIAVIPTSDTFSSVLLGIPGSSASQATVLDGFPLAKQGHAARALSAAFASSLFGGLCGAIVLTFFILIARPLILAFGLPEMLMISILGLSMVAVLAGRVALKGLAAAGLGLLIGTMGIDNLSGQARFTFGQTWLLGGLDLIVVLFNDGSYGAEHIQFRDKQLDPSITLFDWPEFTTVARALSGDGVAIRCAGDLDALPAALENRPRTAPFLIDVHLDPDFVAMW
mgnify:CR=1 FL=1